MLLITVITTPSQALPEVPEIENILHELFFLLGIFLFLSYGTFSHPDAGIMLVLNTSEAWYPCDAHSTFFASHLSKRL